MSIEFENAILAGVTLIREAIQSQNFVTGVDGWQIKSDGTAEFSDLTIRSSDGSGSTVVVANGEILIKNAMGNTVVQINATGYTLFNADGDTVAQITLDQGGSTGGFYTRGFQFPTNIAAFLYGGGMVSAPVTSGLVDISGFLQYNASLVAAPFYTAQTLSTGAKDFNLDDEARLQLISERGKRSVVWADGGSSSVYCDFHATGNLISDLGFISGVADIGRGPVAYLATTASVGGITAEAVVMSKTGVVFQAGRAYRITLRNGMTSTVAGDRPQYRVRKQGLGGALYLDTAIGGVIAAAGLNQQSTCENIVINPNTFDSTQTLAVTAARQAGTGNISFVASTGSPGYFLVEDIGDATAFPNAPAIAP
ncbi:hypothetical protein ACWC9H_35410 [Streptomyces sp. NPDC001251]